MGRATINASFSYTGLIDGDTSSIFSGGLTTIATAASNPGSYDINQGTLSAGTNYLIAYTSGTLTVNPFPSFVRKAFSDSSSPLQGLPAPFDPGKQILIDPRLIDGQNSPFFAFRD